MYIKEKESLTHVITAPYQLKPTHRWHRTIENDGATTT